MEDNATSYLSLPKVPNGAGILVLHAWWGFTPFFRGLCDRLADQGYVVLAPDLYHGATADTIEEAERLSATLSAETAMHEIRAAVAQLRSHHLVQNPLIGVVAFSLGGYFSLEISKGSECGIGATVIFYATNAGDYSLSTSAFQFHLAESDDYESESQVIQQRESFSSSGKEAEFFVYSRTTHWFFEPDVADAYNPDAAKLAWERTLAFLNSNLQLITGRDTR